MDRLLHGNRQIPKIPGLPVSGADKAVHAAGEMEQIHAAVLQQPTVLHGASTGLIVTAAQPQGNGKGKGGQQAQGVPVEKDFCGALLEFQLRRRG